MSAEADRLRKRVIDAILARDAHTSVAERRAAFDANHATFSDAGKALLAKVTKTAWKVTDEDVAAAKATGLTEDQLFELIVCAALGEATRQHDHAAALLDEAFA